MGKHSLWAATLAALCVGLCLSDDSLRGALEAINRRQRDLSDSTLYYMEHFRPSQPQERTMYPHHSQGDGQLEDIGYGYQKSLAPKTAGVFEAVPLPESELGSHSPGVETHKNLDSFDEKALEDIAMNIIQHYKTNNLESGEPERHFGQHTQDTKRSVFRERDISDLPDSLQNLSPDDENSQRFFENGEHTAPSLFRERYTSKPSRKHNARNAQALVRNFGGLNRDEDNFPSANDDSDEYLSMLNSVWEKYQDSNPDALDPEDLSESDVEEIMDYLSHKGERKRQPENSYQTGYDFYNSPLSWVKRDRQRLTENSKPSGDQFLHALKFLNSQTDALESLREDDVPDEERDEDVERLLLEDQAQKMNRRYTKRFWRGNSYEDHNRISKRYPITKRSPSYYTNPAVMYHKVSNEKFSQRKKKNVKSHSSEDSTDPKVAQEINDIFSHSDNLTKEKSSDSTPDKAKTNMNSSISSDQSKHTNNDTKSLESTSPDHIHGTHMKRKRSGQKEETSFESQHKPLDVEKKAVRWNEYFGIDRRRKKSLSKPTNDEWLLDQYLKAYSISARAIQDSSGEQNEETDNEGDKKGVDDMDAKLRAMEDMIVDQALKYTGAHEGTTDSDEVQEVKDRVIAQLAAAYSLEKMRKALSEFKSSMAAQKASTHTTTNAPTDVPEQKDKRVAVKKEKAGLPPDPKLEKKNSDNDLSVMPSHEHQHSRPAWEQEESCPILEDISVRCSEIANMAGDSSQTLAPLCNLHQVCYLCGAELGTAASGCDLTFLSEANGVCGESPRCRYTVRRTMAAMRSLRGDPSPLGCDWQHHPCLARYLAITVR